MFVCIRESVFVHVIDFVSLFSDSKEKIPSSTSGEQPEYEILLSSLSLDVVFAVMGSLNFHLLCTLSFLV